MYKVSLEHTCYVGVAVRRHQTGIVRYLPRSLHKVYKQIGI